MQENKLRQHDLEIYNSVSRIRSKFGRIEEFKLIEQVIALLGYKYLSNNATTSKDIGYELDDSLHYENLLINKGSVIETLQKGIAQITKNNNNIQSSDVFYDLFEFIDFNTFNENEMWLDLIDAVEKLCSETTATIGEIILFLNKYPSGFKLHFQPTNDIIKLVTTNQGEVKNIYDPFVDSGTLLTEIGKIISVENYYGQHPNKEKCARAKMTLLTNGVNYKNIFIKCNDITEPISWNVKFDLCVTIPPFGRKDKLFYDDDIRFQPCSPKRASEQAYLLDMLYHLDENGTIKMIVPDGVLWRGGSEKIIIQYLVDNELISTIIGLPAGIFTTTAIVTTLLILNKTSNTKGIYYLNLRNAQTQRISKRSAIKIEDIDKYIEILSKHEEMELTSKIATIEDIQNNDYNLAINRYVDQEKLEKIDMKQTIANIKAIKKELKQVDEELNEKIEELLKQ